MTRVADWLDPARAYDCDPAEGTVRDAASPAGTPARGFGCLLRFGLPPFGRRRFVWACADGDGLALGVDDEVFRSRDGALSASWRPVAPFVYRLELAHGGRAVSSSLHLSLEGRFPEDAHGAFGSFLQHLFSSGETTREYLEAWAKDAPRP